MKKLLCLMLAIMMMLSSFSMTLAEDVVEVVTETPAPTEAVVTEPEPASEPAQPVVTEPASEPEQSAVTEPATEPEQPVITEPATEPEQPVVTEPATDPEQPVVTEPATEPEQPVVTEPATETEQPAVAEPAAEDAAVDELILRGPGLEGIPGPGVVPTLKVTNAKPNALKLTWTSPSTGADGYEMSLSKNADFSSPVVRETTNTYYDVTGLVCGLTYYYRVRAYKLDGAEKVFGVQDFACGSDDADSESDWCKSGQAELEQRIGCRWLYRGMGRH